MTREDNATAMKHLIRTTELEQLISQWELLTWSADNYEDWHFASQQLATARHELACHLDPPEHHAGELLIL